MQPPAPPPILELHMKLTRKVTMGGGGGSRVEVPGLSSGQQGPAMIEEGSKKNPVMVFSGERCADVPVLGSAARGRASLVPAPGG